MLKYLIIQIMNKKMEKQHKFAITKFKQKINSLFYKTAQVIQIYMI